MAAKVKKAQEDSLSFEQRLEKLEALAQMFGRDKINLKRDS